APRAADAALRSAGDPRTHHRARLGHPLRQRQQRRRSPHQLTAQQSRPWQRRAADSHGPRRRLRAPRQARVKPLALRTSLTVLVTTLMALLVTLLALAY